MGLHGWGALATVLLVFETFVVVLIAGVILYFLVRGMAYVLREVPRIFAAARRYLAQGQNIVNTATSQVAAPFIAANAGVARVRGILAGIGKLFAP
jgi:hypothetical protein